MAERSQRLEKLMKRIVRRYTALCLALVGTLTYGQSCDAINLDQNWTASQSEEFWFTSQGSRLMPYSWFMALEVAAGPELFTSAANMDRYGYISVPASTRNPDGLPIGFVKDSAAGKDDAVGLTCAACHTGSLNIKGRRVIVEGGPSLSDFWLFLNEAVRALRATDTDSAKFARFSQRVMGTADLHTKLKSKLADLETRLRQNTSLNPYGYGRVDAFGHILTRVLAQGLNVPANAEPPYAPAKDKLAPVSFPFLWDTPQHDVVQWNGVAPNSKLLSLGPLSRNVGEVLGVFGELEIKAGRSIPFLPFLSTPPTYTSSAKIQNMVALENQVKSLWSPVWPQKCLPLAAAPVLARGKSLYEANCVGCHLLLGDPERKDPGRQIEAKLSPLSEIRTDPTMAMNFAARTAKTGPLEGAPNLIKFRPFGAEASGHEILLAAVQGVVFGGIDGSDPTQVNIGGFLVNPLTELRNFKIGLEAGQNPRYKARPLNGIWATAPYLHNGSVPTLWDLLQPPAARPATFSVGSREFDPVKVGYSTGGGPGTFLYNTSPQGNWRNGHEYGLGLTDAQKRDLLEFLKTL